MRITLLSHFPGRGGSTSLLSQLQKFFEHRGHRTTVVVGQDSPDPQIANYRVFGGPPQADWRERLRQYRGLVESTKPDLVYLVSGLEESDLLRFLSLPRVRHTFTLERHHFMDVPFWLKQLGPYWEAVTANTPDVVDEIQRLVPGSGSGYFLPYWLDATFYEQKPPRKESQKTVEVCYVGRLEEYQKRVQWVAEVARRCRAAGVDLRWHIYGTGPAEGLFRKRLAQLNGAELVEFHGWLQSKELAHRLRQHDIWFSCSRFEGLPVALLEAMFCGLACVAPDLPGGVHYVVEQGGAVGYPSHSLRAGAKLLEEVARDTRELSRLKWKTRETAERLFGPELVQRKYLELEAAMQNLRFNGRVADLSTAPRMQLISYWTKVRSRIYRFFAARKRQMETRE